MSVLHNLFGDSSIANVMIDLETMGLRPTSAIVSIGAVHFDHEQVLHEFYTSVSLASCMEHGLTTDQSTVDWWMKQSPEARAAWQTTDAPSLLEALTAFSKWLRDLGARRVRPWGNGADFDLVLMANAYRAVGADTPWKYYDHSCYRTLRTIFPVELQRQGTHHHALDDARYQVGVVHEMYKAYGR